MKSAKVLDVRAVVSELEIRIDAPRERVWKALVDELDAWWLSDYCMLGEGSKVTLETEAGGHMIERHPDGGSLLWYVVQWCKPGEFLYLYSPLSHEFGGPAGTLLKLALEETAAKTTLKVTQEMYGHVADGCVESLEEGWKQIFSDGLKRYVEGGSRDE